jgi:hypothetical protein
MPSPKERRIQVRVTEGQHIFLRQYAEAHDLSISQMMRDFIEWLKKREVRSESQTTP